MTSRNIHPGFQPPNGTQQDQENFQARANEVYHLDAVAYPQAQ